MEQITITAKVQIAATDTDKVLLNKTMSVYCDACNPELPVSYPYAQYPLSFL